MTGWKAMTTRRLAFLLGMGIFLSAAPGVLSETGRDERAALASQEKALRSRVAMLKREQDYLLFQKAMYSADSKYLLIHSATRSAQLKYKNRLLKEFEYEIGGKKRSARLAPGKFILTRKAEGKQGRHALIFGTSFVLQWKRNNVPSGEAKIPVLVLNKKVMQSVFYSFEEGDMAYVVN